MSKQVSLPKISSILQKMKIGQNSIYRYALFVRSPSIVEHSSDKETVLDSSRKLEGAAKHLTDSL